MHYPHVVQFSGADENALVAGIASYVAQALEGGGVAVVVTPELRWQRVHERLAGNHGIGVDERLSNNRLYWFDADETLSHFFDGKRVDADGFDRSVAARMRAIVSRARARPVYAYGDMVSVLWETGHQQAAIELERFWNDLGAQIPFNLYCGYAIDAHEAGAAAITGLHSATV